jgi:hypothetical protein
MYDNLMGTQLMISNLLFKNLSNNETVHSISAMNCIVVEDNSCHVVSKYTPHRKVFPIELRDIKDTLYVKHIYLYI